MTSELNPTGADVERFEGAEK